MNKTEQTNNSMGWVKWFRWHYMKTFYLLNKEELFLMYRKINKDSSLTPANWNRFNNSKELYDLACSQVAMISRDLLDTIAYGESTGNLGMEIHTHDFAVYVAIPMIIHDNVKSIEQQTAIQRQVATRAFITVLCHMFFKDLYEKPFTILKEDNGWFTLNENYEYVKE